MSLNASTYPIALSPNLAASAAGVSRSGRLSTAFIAIVLIALFTQSGSHRHYAGSADITAAGFS
jgi:hypothetical protein